MTIVNLAPNNKQDPSTWRSLDASDPEVVLWRRANGMWTARLERRTVGHAESPELLIADLYGEHGLQAILDANQVAAA